MGIQIAGDPVPEGRDASTAPLEQASPDKARPAGGTPPGGGPPAPAATEPGRVTLATIAPLDTLHVPPLDDGGEAVVITQDGTEVDQATAERAREAAQQGGFRLAEL